MIPWEARNARVRFPVSVSTLVTVARVSVPAAAVFAAAAPVSVSAFVRWRFAVATFVAADIAAALPFAALDPASAGAVHFVAGAFAPVADWVRQ